MPWPLISSALGQPERGAERGGVRGAIDWLLENIGLTTGPAATGAAEPDARSTVGFTIAIIALAAKLSKADGVSSPIEAATFFAIYQVPPAEKANVARLFEQASQDARGFEHYADQIARLFKDEPQLKLDVLEALFHIAAADGILHSGEDVFLKEVAARFGLSPEQYASTRSRFVVDANDPYTILGIYRRAGNDEIKAHYRQLVKDTHPDTMVARGVPAALTAHANRKLATINAAYECIARERGL